MKKIIFLLALVTMNANAITLEALIKEHGKDKVIHLISARTNHKLTISVDGETKIAVAPSAQYITINTLKADLKRENITADDIANDLIEQNKRDDDEKRQLIIKEQAQEELQQQEDNEKLARQEAIQKQLDDQNTKRLDTTASNLGLTPDEFVSKFNRFSQSKYTLPAPIIKPGQVNNIYQQNLTDNCFFIATIIKDSNLIHDMGIITVGKSKSGDLTPFLITVIIQTLNSNISVNENTDTLSRLIRQAALNKGQSFSENVQELTYSVTSNEMIWLSISISKK